MEQSKDTLKKEFYKEINGYKIYKVDGKAVRDLGLEMEEFSNYGIHPKLKSIPKDEIWLDKKYSVKDLYTNAIEAVNWLKYINAGFSSDKAYEKAEKRTKAHIGKLSGDKKKIKSYNKDDDKRLKKKKIKSLTDGIIVYRVSGDYVRERFKQDFVEGGNGYAYPWMPKDEIWIEDTIEESEVSFIIEHEWVEAKFMKEHGYDYQHAHKLASIAEFGMRTQKNGKQKSNIRWT